MQTSRPTFSFFPLCHPLSAIRHPPSAIFAISSDIYIGCMLDNRGTAIGPPTPTERQTDQTGCPWLWEKRAGHLGWNGTQRDDGNNSRERGELKLPSF